MKNKNNQMPVTLEVINENGYDNMYLILEDGTRFAVKYSFYNYKLSYKVKKAVENYVNK